MSTTDLKVLIGHAAVMVVATGAMIIDTIKLTKKSNGVSARKKCMFGKKKIKIKYFDKTISKIEKIDVGDWNDLRVVGTHVMKKGEFKLLPLGVAMKLPKGYEAHVVPRSSTYKNYKIIQTNHQGVIDESYCGSTDQWFFPAYALEDTTINHNDRICQFRIMKKQPSIKFEEVEELTDPSRGGCGSTGTR